RMELCGSLRRRKETIRDISILISTDDPGPILERFIVLPGVVQVIERGEANASVVVERSLGHSRRVVMNANLRAVRDEEFPFALYQLTGSKEHTVALRARAAQYGLTLNEHELAGPEGRLACQEEAGIFEALHLDYIPPELREYTGEIEAA